MVARSEQPILEVCTKLSAPLPKDAVEWRQDGKPMQRDGKFFARFVAYISANTVRERLDSVVPLEWDLSLELLPARATDATSDGEPAVSFKARLQILGVIREDVGTGRDYKSAATDAFKRAGVRFGIAHELYDYDQNWVQVDGDGRYAKPLEDPGAAYARRMAKKGEGSGAERRESGNGSAVKSAKPPGAGVPANEPARQQPAVEPTAPLALDEPSCPKCGGRMWDNRLSKRNPKAPDFKCRNRACDGVVWPAKIEEQRATAARTSERQSENGSPEFGDIPPLDESQADDDQIPF